MSINWTNRKPPTKAKVPSTAPIHTVYGGIDYPHVEFYDAQAAQVLPIPQPSKLFTQDLLRYNDITYGISQVITIIDTFKGNSLRVVLRPLVVKVL